MRTLLVLLVQLGRMSQPKVAAGLAVVVCASQVHSDDDALMKPARVGRGQHLWRVQRASVCELEQTGQREGGAAGSAYRHLGAARAVMRCSKEAFFSRFGGFKISAARPGDPKEGCPDPQTVLRNHWLLRGRWWHMVPSCCCASPPSTNAEDAHGKGSSTCLLLQQQQRQRSRLMVLVVAVTTTQLWRRHHSAAQQQQQPCSGGGRSGQQSIAAQPQPSLQVVRLPVAWQASCASFSSKNVCTATLREDVLQLCPELDRATSHEHKEQQQQLYSVQQHHHS